MISIIVDDTYSYILGAPLDALAIVGETCRAHPSGYQYMPKYKEGYWDGYISLMQNMRTFPSGLLELVIAGLGAVGYECVVEYTKSKLPHTQVVPTMLNGIMLRDYQCEAANIMLHAGRGVAKMATNSGKTEVIAAMIKALDFKKTIVIVPGKDLLYQTSERLQDRFGGMEIGVVGDGKFELLDVTVATVQTLYSKINILPTLQCDIIFIDECHHVSNFTTMDVLFRLQGVHRYGFSGTPLRYDRLSDLKLIAATGPVLVDISNNFLISKDYSASPTVYMHVIEDSEGWELEYNEAYEHYIVNNDVRNDTIATIANKCNGVTLILVTRIDHGNMLKGIIKNCTFLHGSLSIEERKAGLEKMRTCKSGVFVATSIFDEGVDVPSVGNLIIAGGGKSVVKLLQRIGRGLRKKEFGENELMIHDFIDDTNKYLLAHSGARADTYAQEKFSTKVVR